MGAAQGSAPPFPPKRLESPLGIPVIEKARRRRCGRPASAPFAGTVQAPAVVWACFLVAPPTTVSNTAGFSGVPLLACAVSRLPATLRAAEPLSRREPSSPITPSAPSPDASAAQRPPRLRESAHQPPARRSLPSCLESMQTRMIASPAQGPRKPFPFGFACG